MQWLKIAQIVGTLLVSHINGATLENGVANEPEVECGSDSIVINFNTKEQFEGHVYVKGHYDAEECREDATLTRSASLTIPFSACDVRRQRSSNPLGLYISVTVVITFHPMFITMVDKAYNVQCFYMEADKQVTAELGVSLSPQQYQQVIVMLGGGDGQIRSTSQLLRNVTGTELDMLTTQTITQSVPMPTCTYQVLQGDANGAPVRYAAVGAQVYHKWQCGSSDVSQDPSAGIFCMTVHSCNVDNGQGRRVQLLDENGCATDRYLLNNLDYIDDVTAGQSSMVFKFADVPTVFFKCQVRLTLKENGECVRTSSSCAEPQRGKRQAEASRSQLPPGQDVDVYSDSITVFELDSPTRKDESGNVIGVIYTASAADVGLVNERADVLDVFRRRLQHDSSLLPTSFDPPFCLSPVTFGILVAVLGTVLLTCLVAIALLCIRREKTKSALRFS